MVIAGRSSPTYVDRLKEAWQAHLAPRFADAPTVVSLFAGCGGSSLGYSMAGYRELLAVEWDANAVATFKLNFPDVPVYHGDIAALSVERALEMSGLRPGELDVLDGSPPCQGFSTAGKRRLDDPRNDLFREYVRLLKGLQPRAFVMENVSGMVKGKMRLVFVECLRELKAAGYRVSARVLNAMYFGVPQSRARTIFIGVRNDLDRVPSHPDPEVRPVILREAWHDLSTVDIGQRAPTPSPLKAARWRQTRPGGNHAERFSLSRLAWNATPGTVQQTATGSTGTMHPDEPRELNERELKRIGGFPDGFLFTGRWTDALARIGNSVPPLFMRSLAAHLRQHVLEVVP